MGQCEQSRESEFFRQIKTM